MASIRPSATASLSLSSARASSTTDVSVKPSSSTQGTTVQVPVTATPVIPESTASPAVDSANPLPIHPKVTPAMGISGALLLITGLVYAVIGIKNKWIYVFGSAAYLTALAVTVLIIYLMNPPVSDGVQGAFFVAAFFTGLIFGVLSLVFADITEGFGCLLGGFCLSMWFLSLKEGGLITSPAGRAIFIGCMSAGGYSLSFSRYTRNYGLIASISFSGATATMLGIDCLACAGWKEFWLYLWNLNDAIFPLNTNTYPLTKNIKAELAGVVIIAVFGVVSQLRVWNMVKEHREKSAAQELQKRQEQEREDEARGRKVEDSFQKERAQWEAAYGNKSIPTSSERSSSPASHKRSHSIREKETYTRDNVEMMNLTRNGVAMAGTTVTVSVLKDDDIQEIDANGNPIAVMKTPHLDDTNSIDKDASLPALPSNTPNRTGFRLSVPPPPPVVPLPFTIPRDDEGTGEEDNVSVSAAPESDHGAKEGRQRLSKRISDMALSMQLANRHSRIISESAEALVAVPHIEDDRASSVAATLDGEYEDILSQDLSPPHSPMDTGHESTPDPDAVTEPLDSTDETCKKVDTDASAANEASPKNPPVFRQSLTSGTDPKPSGEVSGRISQQDSRIRADTLVPGDENDDHQGQKSRRSYASVPGSVVGNLNDGVLQARLSKVASSYRTNEWAKHLEAAEKPDLDELTTASSFNANPVEIAEEKPAPVHEDTACSLPGSRRVSRRTSLEPGSNTPLGLNRSYSTFSQTSLVDQHVLTQPSPPAPAATAATSGILSRSNSGAQMDTLVPLPSNTLLGQRETLMRKRTSSHSFSLNGSASNLLEQAEQDDMSLAQRRQLLQHHQSTSPGLVMQASSTAQRKAPPSASQKWQNKGWAIKGAPLGFDSHQPRRTTSSQSDQKREELYAGWRSSMQDVAPPQTQAYVAEQQRKALMQERRQKEMEKQQREAAQQQRASMMDSMMRSGHMLDAHREAMRKMQANANRHAS